MATLTSASVRNTSSNLNGDEHEFERETLYAKCHSFKRFAVDKNTVMLDLGEEGLMMIEVKCRGVKSLATTEVCFFTYTPREQKPRKTFWFNRSSIKELGYLLRANSNKRVRIDQIS
jgi:hypothetical protein